IPELRLAVQRLLRSTNLQHEAASQTGQRTPSGSELYSGRYFEVELRHPSLHWKGFADLVEITASGDVTILDFKTGEPKQTHEQQLLLYALLWARDGARNPKRRLATKLILQYLGEAKIVDAPNSDVLATLEEELAERSSTIRDALTAIP